MPLAETVSNRHLLRPHDKRALRTRHSIVLRSHLRGSFLLCLLSIADSIEVDDNVCITLGGAVHRNYFFGGINRPGDGEAGTAAMPADGRSTNKHQNALKNCLGERVRAHASAPRGT